MERTELFDLMGELKLYGMKDAFDEIMATAVKRQHEPQRIDGTPINESLFNDLAGGARTGSRRGPLQAAAWRSLPSMRVTSVLPASSTDHVPNDSRTKLESSKSGQFR
jgi:hypothetical protein